MATSAPLIRKYRTPYGEVSARYPQPQQPDANAGVQMPGDSFQPPGLGASQTPQPAATTPPMRGGFPSAPSDFRVIGGNYGDAIPGIDRDATRDPNDPGNGRQNMPWGQEVVARGQQPQMQQPAQGGWQAPAQNATQRWQGAAQDPGAIRQNSPQRRFFNYTGRIDARATPSPMNGPGLGLGGSPLTPGPDWSKQFEQRTFPTEGRRRNIPGGDFGSRGTVPWSPY